MSSAPSMYEAWNQLQQSDAALREQIAKLSAVVDEYTDWQRAYNAGERDYGRWLLGRIAKVESH